MKVLISDKISDSAIDILKKEQIDFDYKGEITPQELLSVIKDYRALIVRSRTKVTKDVILQGKDLKIVGRVGSGVDNIDMKSCRQKKIIVVNAPTANSQSVAEHTVGLMIALLRKYSQAFSSMREGLWWKKELSGQELADKTIGIVGYGHIGKKVELLVRAFGAHPLVFSRHFLTCDLQELFTKSDIISIHLSLNDDTRGYINRSLLNLMKPTAYLINTSRGETVDEKALFDILLQNKISGAALDVFWQEPLAVDSPWRKLANVVLTPHIGASTKEALMKASIVVLNDVVLAAKGKQPKNIVS